MIADEAVVAGPVVVDASVAVAALLTNGQARAVVVEADLHAPHLIDSEVVSAVRRRTAAGQLDVSAARLAVSTWSAAGIRRHPVTAILDRIWRLRDNLSAYDATYAALAEALECPLVTLDRRLVRSPGVPCEVQVLAS
ncbi:MAG: type II toxin-antitoxin system VapC family toxin [Angustibacter sp.]